MDSIRRGPANGAYEFHVMIQHQLPGTL
jgi:hypothetical protein